MPHNAFLLNDVGDPAGKQTEGSGYPVELPNITLLVA